MSSRPQDPRRFTRRRVQRPELPHAGRARDSRRDGKGTRRRSWTQGVWMWLAVVVLAILSAGALNWWNHQPLEVPEGFSDDAVAAEMVRVIDGDTIVVAVEGEEERVRLLNIDTPETVHPSEPVECGGPEASEAIRGVLSPGDVVVLEFDEELRDRYDRLLAGVFVDDIFVNEHMALEGWGEPAYFAPNDRFLAIVEEAWTQAEADEAGMFSPQLAC
ncbi:thermonuclease family protein [Nesterenkonia sphaerica]|uniref:Thermonuclease family protein n=1 Tax=Nesterenkonia sphaerica TaxID=1804988 RepID=A0A5R9ACM8_9MICC|nr:thermonuclease family protein [Nesterenkonia sphaerica]TLP75607.1 thermonuclease family protein [Nesterenkonia sphaerica]